jgi:hypothetical protein
VSAIVVFVDVKTTVVVELVSVVEFPVVELVSTVVVAFEIISPIVELLADALNAVEV